MEQIAKILSELPKGSFFMMDKSIREKGKYRISLGIKITKKNKHLSKNEELSAYSNLYYTTHADSIENGLKESLDKYHESLKEIS